MARLALDVETLRSLFAKSGNVCAYPGCTHELVTTRNVFVGQLCHIEAANPAGPRYNPTSSDEARRAYANIILLCYRHHKETDDTEAFTVRSLQKMKADHEGKYGEKPFKVNEAFLHRLEFEMESFWASVANATRDDHIVPEYAVPIPMGQAGSAQFADVYRAVDRLGEVFDDLFKGDCALNEEIREYLQSLGYEIRRYDEVPYYRNPFSRRNWETHALLANNTRIDLAVALKQTEVRFLEEYAKTHPDDQGSLEALERAKAELHKMATSTGYVD